MKQLNKNVFLSMLAILGLFTACTSSNQHLIVENIPIAIGANVATDIFTGGESLAMFQDSLIVGYGNGYAYSTADFFQNTLVAEDAESDINSYKLIYKGFPELIKWEETDTTIEIKYSENFGKTYSPMLSFPLREPNGIYGYGFYFISGTEGWLCKSHRTNFGLTPDWVALYKINGENLTFLVNLTTKYQIKSYASLLFLDSQRGWIIYGENIKYTSDGGLTWTGNASIPESVTPYIQNGHLYLRGYNNTSFLYTSESETFSTYETTILPDYISNIYMLNSQVGYSISENSELEIHKTIDAAKTWNIIHTVPEDIYDNPQHLDIEFKDEMTGFFMIKDQLFYTRDGGVNWRVGIYDAP